MTEVVDHVLGDLEAVGGAVQGFTVGERIAISPSRPCGACRFCQLGLQNHCLDMRYFGSAMRMPRDSTCGSANTLSMVLMGPHGTAADSSRVIQSPVLRVRVMSRNSSISSTRWASRALLVAKRSLLASSG